jgi:hypothetical protein
MSEAPIQPAGAGDGCANPIIGGGGALVYPAIASPNFNLANPLASPSPSWAILKSGIAYFFGLVLSGGTITGPNYIISSAGIFIYSGTPAAGNLIIAVCGPATTQDSFGNSVQPGDASALGTVITMGGTPAGGTPSFVQLVPASPAQVRISGGEGIEASAGVISGFTSGSGGGKTLSTLVQSPRVTGAPAAEVAQLGLNSSSADLTAAPTAFLFASDGTLTGQLTMSLSLMSVLLSNGFYLTADTAQSATVAGFPLLAPTAAGGQAADTWHTPGLSNGWAAASTFKYCPLPLSPGGTLGATWIVGNLDPAAVTGGFPSTVFTLAARYRPASTLDFPVGEHQGAAGPAAIGAFIRVSSSGTVQVLNGTVGMGVLVVNIMIPLGY